jgi:hypothetical protein
MASIFYYFLLKTKNIDIEKTCDLLFACKKSTTPLSIYSSYMRAFIFNTLRMQGQSELISQVNILVS